MKLIKKILAFTIVVSMMVQMNSQIYGATNTTVQIIKQNPVVTMTDQGERIFEITYNFKVQYEQVLTGLDVVLVLDRSNSMLRPDPSTGLPVAAAVWTAVNTFVTEVYKNYPQSNIAIVSFGTNGNKSDNWKYYNNLQDTLKEIKSVYDYRNLETNYHSNFSAYKNNGYKYAWENWQISDGATNIKAAFEYAQTTVSKKQTTGTPSDQNVIVLFTDGVATQGGSKSQSNYNYPTSHNTNTIAAYEAGKAAQSVAEVIAVGYFEGIEYNDTKVIARDTLQKSQNAGLFEAAETAHLTSIFDKIVEDLNYIGTNAKVVETVQKEFEIVPNSIQPSNNAVTTDSQGRQVITWELGNVIDTSYSFGYKVKVKDTAYPTGTGSTEIPINVEAKLIYKDLNGLITEETLGQNKTIIPPRNNQPLVGINTVYQNNQYGYLVGDTIKMDQNLSFTNVAPFDYKKIEVNEFTKMMESQTLADYLSLSDTSKAAGWTTLNNTYKYNVGASKTAVANENLVWSKHVPLELKAIKVGSFQLTNKVTYNLVNSFNVNFDFVNQVSDSQTVTVKSGTIELVLKDDLNVPITNPEVKVDGVVVTYTVNASGTLSIANVKSGNHTVSFTLPSGYVIPTLPSGVTMNSSNVITVDVQLSYTTPLVSKTINFERLKIKDIFVTTMDGLYTKSLAQLNETTSSKISFELLRPLTKIEMTLYDDFADSYHKFALNQVSGKGEVRNAAGTLIPGFTVVNGIVSYNGTELPAGKYVAYGAITPPTTLGKNLDYDFNVGVNQIKTRETGDTVDTTTALTSKALYLGVIDTVAPVITVVHDPSSSSLNLINQDITISDKLTIVTFKVFEGTLTYQQVLAATKEASYKIVENKGNLVTLDGDIRVTLTKEGSKLVTKGSITIYAVDAFGNYTVKVVDYYNNDLNNVLDQNLI